jgi:hypothetical protein
MRLRVAGKYIAFVSSTRSFDSRVDFDYHFY